MNKNKRKQSFLDNLVEFISESEDQTTEEIKEELREEGIDPDSLIDKINKTISKHI